ncbi:hypothetical protein GS416_05550 [Rhodococcus hoagii]|nr:hypothetical protein [Prescottella equi]
MTAAPEQPRSYWTPPPAEYQEIEWRETPSYQQQSYNSGYSDGGYDSGYDNGGYSQPYYGEPIRVEQLHLPTYVEPVAPIQAPEERLRLGDYITRQADWMSPEYLDRTNHSAAVAEAQMATFWKSVGVDVVGLTASLAATVGVRLPARSARDLPSGRSARWPVERSAATTASASAASSRSRSQAFPVSLRR